MTKLVRPCLALNLFLFPALTAFAATPTVTLATPTNNATVSSPVHFVASASSPDCSKGISAIRIYSAPGVSAYTLDATSHINAYVSLANGTYNAIVQAWDNCGGVSKAPVKITVNAQSAPAGFLYTVNSAYDYGNHNVNNVIGYQIVAGGNGALALTAQAPVNTNIFPQSAASDQGGYRLYVGDYVSGDVFAYYIYRNNGYIYPVPGSPFPVKRSVAAVAVHPSGHYVFAARNEDAPGDGVGIFHVESNGSLAEIPGSPVPTQNGPRTMVVDPSGKYLYVGDDSGYLDAFEISDDGSLTPLPGEPYKMTTTGGECGALPNDIIDPFGVRLYTANRGDDSISGFNVDASTGTLTQVSGSPWPDNGGCGSPTCPQCNFNPMSITIDGPGHFLYAQNGDIENISIYSINKATGALTYIKDLANQSSCPPGPIRTDPGGNYLYTTGCGSGYLSDIDIYMINHTTGDLTPSPSSPVPIPETGTARPQSFVVTQ